MNYYFEKSLHLEGIEYEEIKALAVSFSQFTQQNPELKEHDLYEPTVKNIENAGVLVVVKVG